MKLKKLHTIIEHTPEDVKEEVNLSMDILERIHELLDEKFDGKQKLLADKLNKSEAEISKWLSGVQNFTIKTLVKLEVAFGEPIIAVCTKNENSTYRSGELKAIQYNKSINLESYCMSGKGMTKTEALQMAEIIKKDKAAQKIKQ
jgi:transcriptional regulator with XRE-family HTH domain